MVTLQRRQSGFILYPKGAPKRICEGTATFRTKCDMLVGPCACGNTHQECDQWVQNLLSDEDYQIPTMVLPVVNGQVSIPRYWRKSNSHRRCTVLHGKCACGKIHKATSQWVRVLLKSHNATIEGMNLDLNLPMVIREEYLNRDFV